ncbi:MAG: T9SS type A sorting domain-containing protein [Gilvibacter sp.]
MKRSLLHLLILLIASTTLNYGQTAYNIYVSDAGNFSSGPYQILKFDPDGSNPQTFIDTNLAWPQDILFLEDQGIVLISNLSTGEINRHDAQTGAYIDHFSTGIGGPTRMKIGADDLIYVLQWVGNGKVWRYEQDGTFVDEFTSTGVAQSIGIDWDAAGNLYVSSYTGDLVQKYSSSGADMGTFISTDLVGPTNIWFDATGDLFVADYDGGAVKRFDSDGNFIEVYISGLQFPEGVAFNPSDGNMLLGNGGTAAVKLFTSTGTFIEDIVPSGSGDLLTPNAVVLRDNSLGVPHSNSVVNMVNPTIGQLFVFDFALLEDFDKVAIYNFIGQKISTVYLADSLLWDASGMPDGIYFLTAFKGDKRVTQKIIVTKR